MAARDILIGVDVGGTFTDAVVIADGRSFRAKSPSTYPDIGRGVLAACRLAAQSAGEELAALLPRVKKFGLGTTAVTNVIATRTGLKTGLITTKGFEETLRLARGRTQEEDGWLKSVDALVDARAIVGIDERIDRNGVVLKVLDPEQVVAAARYLAEEAKVESIAVSFLWSFLNQSHEREAARLIRETLPGMPVSAGVELRPVIREYERTTLAVLNAYSKGAYRGVDDLAHELRAAGLEAPVLLCHSGGGAISIEQAREQPVWLSASGPAAGVAAAAKIAQDAGEERVLTCDLGGTSFDVAHLADGAPARTQRGDLMGFWTALPRVDVESVGAGGGSLSWIDERSMLRVGPRSAGSNPGPVCYGRGGTQVALTDALLVLGYIDPDNFLGGTMKLDKEAAVAACDRLGADLGLGAIEAAWGVREIAVAEMVKAVRARLSNHALAASEHCLVSYGGCGSLFSSEVARLAGLKRVIVPELASVLSAYGAATMDIRRERLTTLLMKLPGDADTIDRTFEELREAVWQDLAADGVPEADREVRFEVDMRWFLQRWELTVPIPGDPVRGDAGKQVEALFREEYLRRFGAASTTTSGIVELVGIRAVGIGHMDKILSGTERGTAAEGGGGEAQASSPDLSSPGQTEGAPPPSCGWSPSPAGGGLQQAAPAGTRPVNRKRGAPAETVDVYHEPSLQPGDWFTGPALVDSPDTTIWVPEGMVARFDAERTLVIEAQGTKAP